MKIKVYKQYKGTKKATITLSKKVRTAIQKKHNIQVRPGYPVWVEGSSSHCPRNLIVLRMKKDDPLMNKEAVARIGPIERKRLGMKPGDQIDVSPLKFEIWYHGTRAPDPLNTIIKGKWIVGRSGQGIWLSSQSTIAQGYVGTALITLEVAWEDIVNWPLNNKLSKQFQLWCKEHGEDYNALLNSFNSGTIQWQNDPRILRWARLYGHYFNAWGQPHVVRVFPGLVGENFKGNRVRIVKAIDSAGNIIYSR